MNTTIEYRTANMLEEIITSLIEAAFWTLFIAA